MHVAAKPRVTVLSPRGEITAGNGDAALREAVRGAIMSGTRRVLVDLSGVTTIDSSGIGELISAYTAMANRGGRLALLHVPAHVADWLRQTRLDVFEVFDDEDMARRALSASPA